MFRHKCQVVCCHWGRFITANMLIRQLISKSKLYFLYLNTNHFALVIARLIFDIYGLPLNCKNDYFPKSLSMQLRCHCLLSKIHQFPPRVINFYRKYFSICLPLNTRNFSYLIGVHSVNFTNEEAMWKT